MKSQMAIGKLSCLHNTIELEWKISSVQSMTLLDWYVEKRWIRRDVKVISPSSVKEKIISEIRPVSETRNASRHFVVPKLPKPVYVKDLQKVVSAIKPQEIHQKPELKKEKPREKANPMEPPSELHYATDLFDKYPVELTKHNGTVVVCATEKQPPERSRPDRGAVETNQIAEYKVPSSVAENRSKFNSGIEELLRDFQWNTPVVVLKSVEDAKNGIPNLHDKASVTMPLFTQPPPQKKALWCLSIFFYQYKSHWHRYSKPWKNDSADGKLSTFKFSSSFSKSSDDSNWREICCSGQALPD